jgi:hypothetical protein
MDMHRSRARAATIAGAAAIILLAACSDGDDSSPTSPGLPATDPTRVAGAAEDAAAVEVLYLSHLPQMQTVLAEIDAILAEHETASVARYDLATDEGQAFAEENGLTEHPFFSILIDGELTFELDRRTVSLSNLPQGFGAPDVPEGAWTLDDLRLILDQTTAE